MAELRREKRRAAIAVPAQGHPRALPWREVQEPLSRFHESGSSLLLKAEAQFFAVALGGESACRMAGH
jgi:hypothetical protein